ncbi:hypothetical protein ACQRCQ_09590 [Lachnospiraceae bacterium SGI.085]
MDHNQESTMKTPFYMTYPMQNLYETEMEYERDMQRMKDLYPREVKKILICVEDQCDELEYQGSMMYDEFPDRLMLEKIVDKIYQRLIQEGIIKRPEEPPVIQPRQENQNRNPQEMNERMRSVDENQMQPGENQNPQRERMPVSEGGIDRQQTPSLRMECTEREWFAPPEGQIPPMPVRAQAVEVCMQQRGPGRPGPGMPPPPPGRPGPGMPPPPPGRPGPGMPPPPPPGWGAGHNDPMWGLVGVLLNDEMYRRRCRNRRCRRWW